MAVLWVLCALCGFTTGSILRSCSTETALHDTMSSTQNHTIHQTLLLTRALHCKQTVWQLQLEQCVKGPCDRKWHTHDTMRSLSVPQAQASHPLKHKNIQNYVANDALSIRLTQQCREDSTMAPDQRRRMGGVIGTVVLVLVLQCGLLRPSHAMVPTIEAYVVYAPAFSVAVSSLDSHTLQPQHDLAAATGACSTTQGRATHCTFSHILLHMTLH